ncbi:uncharacterized protein PGTG_07106 [Puccinia graminis f. sp. tritici CRL 75-36-700-3]|uniref:CCHC-type domain-containing protein n=1 Tax=Puccinia graminis f. sp. tritici (strain CRL 75-36-700-3 / race SCCL) TaxID=418459 RepID=E3K979_PUCGT|nr:uncharacterized protein PGTG_07106 [Puccinia graminis f. sp. tritici CRL 75-36-700-3]EFP80854.1 hypothetical protein PGTG_07106 [Puccinia graminis f. sp. tritici CRL 75-36-700-3]
MPIRQMNNPSALIQTIPTLDGNSVTFPSWRNRLQNVLQIQGVLDIVNKTLPRPNNADSKEGKLAVRSPEQRGYNPEDYGADWDALSDMAISTIQLTLSVDLSIRYEGVKPAHKLFSTICDAYEKNTRARRLQLEDAFWTARQDPSQPIAKWIARVCIAASDLSSVKLTPADQQICYRLLRGLDESWKTIRDHLVYSPTEISLDDAIGALEAHEISTSTTLDFSNSEQVAAAAAKQKGRPRCYRCGEKGHHSADCPNQQNRVKFKNSTKQPEARAGATLVATLGNYTSGDEDDSFDEEIDVWG